VQTKLRVLAETDGAADVGGIGAVNADRNPHFFDGMAFGC
jgi:hypothetical protein